MNEIERELQKKLRSEEQKQTQQKEHDKETYIDAAIIFLGTLGPLYFLFFLVHQIFMFTFGSAIYFMGVSLDWIYPIIHGIIWAASVYSVYRKRSVLDDWYKRL